MCKLIGSKKLFDHQIIGQVQTKSRPDFMSRQKLRSQLSKY